MAALHTNTRAELLRMAAVLHSRVSAAGREVASAKGRLKAERAELRKVERQLAARSTSDARQARPDARPGNPNRRDVATRALTIIRAAGEPLPRRELHNRLVDAGVVLNGKDPEMVLGTMLYRDDRVVRLRQFGYWPKDEAYDPAFYLPEHEAVIGATDDTVDPTD